MGTNTSVITAGSVKAVMQLQDAGDYPNDNRAAVIKFAETNGIPLKAEAEREVGAPVPNPRNDVSPKPAVSSDSPQETTSWACPKCTFLNETSPQRCEMCYHTRVT